MKKFFLWFLLIIPAFLYISCASPTTKDTNWREANGKLKILATTAMIDDIVSIIGGEQVDSIALIKGELDPHSYELVKGDDEKFQAADIIFYNGLGLEHGLSLRQNLENNQKAVSLGDAILKEDPSLILIVDGQYDPHIWMDISLWGKIIDPIVHALSSKDPMHAADYKIRGGNLKKEMEREDFSCFALLQHIPSEKRFLVTSHDAFNYFTRRYLADPNEKDWKKRCSAPEGLAPESQMSVSDILHVISHIETYKVSVLFTESNVSRDSINKILRACQEKGLNIRICTRPLFGDSMGDAPSYLAMIKHNAEVIASELDHHE